jgi:hypothetical protein
MCRRRVVRQRIFRRREHAAQRIQLAYHRHTYRGRKRRRHAASVEGQCDACVSQRAVMYLESTEQKLCRPCAVTTMALINARRLRQVSFLKKPDCAMILLCARSRQQTGV